MTKSFVAGAELSVSSEFKAVGGVGIEISLGVKGGVKSGTSFEISKDTSTGVALESDTDGVDHLRDVFLLWTNVQVDIDQRSDGRITAGLGLSGGTALDIVSLTVAELRDPSLIPDEKKARLEGLTAADFGNILSLHPLLDDKSVDPARLRKVRTIQVVGPDQPGDGSLFFTDKLSNAQASGLVRGTSRELSVGLALETGFDVLGILKAKVKAGLTWEWTYETETNITVGRTEEAESRLGSSTVGYHEVIDVYEDSMFKVFAFVSQPGQSPSQPFAISGIVTDGDLPVPNKRVDVVTVSGEVVSTVTNAQGVYRIFNITEGPLQVRVGEKTQQVVLASNQPLDVSFEIQRG